MKKENKKKKEVYVPMAVDIIHHGHVNIILKGKKLGDVVVGLLTDEAIASYKRIPVHSYQMRKKVIEQIKGVEKVMKQTTLDFTKNLLKLRPDYFVHGDDWKTGVQAEKRKKVIELMKTWGGKVIEPKYTPEISTTKMIDGLIERQNVCYICQKSVKKR